MKRITALIIANMLILSCTLTDKTASRSIEQCVKNKTDDVVQDITGTDSLSYYDILIDFEKSMLINDVLKNKSRESYINLFNILVNNDVYIQKYYNENISDIQNYAMISGLVMQDVIFSCPFKAVNSDSVLLNERWDQRFKLAEKMAATGFRNEEKFADYIYSYSKAEFEEVVYRGNAINIILFLMEGAYNREVDYRDSVNIFDR